MPLDELIITGTANATYDLDVLKNTNTRMSSDQVLLIQVHEWREGENPNPEKPEVGQIWLSKKVD